MIFFYRKLAYFLCVLLKFTIILLLTKVVHLSKLACLPFGIERKFLIIWKLNCSLEIPQLRRLKEDVLAQLPPKRRQVICLQLAPVDIQEAKAFTASVEAQRNMTRKGGEACKCGFTEKGLCDCEEEMEDENDNEVVENTCVPRVTSAKYLGSQEIGVAKLRGFHEWLLNNSIFASNEVAEADTELGKTQQKMIIFAHHHKVLDSIQVPLVCRVSVLSIILSTFHSWPSGLFVPLGQLAVPSQHLV